MAIIYKKRIHSSFLIRIAQRRLPSTKAPRCSSAYVKRPQADKMIPVRLSKVTNVKNFLYVLNQRSNKIHRLIFGFWCFSPAGFFTVVSSSAASVGLRPDGRDSDSSGTLVHGVMPWWMGEAGSNDVTMCIGLFCSMYTKPGAVNSNVLSDMPFSASSSESTLRLSVSWLFDVADMSLVGGNCTRVQRYRRERREGRGDGRVTSAEV